MLMQVAVCVHPIILLHHTASYYEVRVALQVSLESGLGLCQFSCRRCSFCFFCPALAQPVSLIRCHAAMDRTLKLACRIPYRQKATVSFSFFHSRLPKQPNLRVHTHTLSLSRRCLEELHWISQLNLCLQTSTVQRIGR